MKTIGRAVDFVIGEASPSGFQGGVRIKQRLHQCTGPNGGAILLRALFFSAPPSKSDREEALEPSAPRIQLPHSSSLPTVFYAKVGTQMVTQNREGEKATIKMNGGKGVMALKRSCRKRWADALLSEGYKGSIYSQWFVFGI